MMNPVATSKKIRLSKSVQAGLADVLIDENRIKQVITNLLNNALKFTPEGGKISIKVSEAPDDPDCVQVTVSDTGRGIPSDQFERIFDRLYQVKIGDAATEHGMGLGLYICRELVELHGGHIWVESDLDKGSAFAFKLPRHAALERSTVLVVDDDPGVIEAVRCILQREDFDVITAGGGVEALRCLDQQVPDAVLIDLEMPDLDGAAALKEIRRNFGALPVIVHTGYPDSELMTRALESSPFTILAKPCSGPQLVETVRMLIRQWDTSHWKRKRKRSKPAQLALPA